YVPSARPASLSEAASSRRAPPVTIASTKESWHGGKPVEAEGMTRLGIEPRTYGLKARAWRGDRGHYFPIPSTISVAWRKSVTRFFPQFPWPLTHYCH